MEQCSGFVCELGLNCAKKSSHSPLPVADDHPVCCPSVEGLDCGKGRQLIGSTTGCLEDMCDPAVCVTDDDCCGDDDTCMVPHGGSVKMCVGPADFVGKTRVEGCSTFEVGDVGTSCSVVSAGCPTHKCASASPGCVQTKELEWQLGGWCCPKQCVLVCSDGGSSASGTSAKDKKNLRKGLYAVVALLVLTLLVVFGLMLFCASKKARDLVVLNNQNGDAFCKVGNPQAIPTFDTVREFGASAGVSSKFLKLGSNAQPSDAQQRDGRMTHGDGLVSVV
jgi:hypothetical protein